MSSPNIQRLQEIKTFPSLVKYLRDELDWPIESEDFEELTYEYEPEELGIDAKTAVKIKEIKQLRPLSSKQPWGIFFINFEPKQLPIVVLRRILRSLVVRKRADAKKSQQAAWQLHDLLFISSYGESEHREITFAHFSEPADRLFGDLPTLRVLGWDDDDTKLKMEHVVHVMSQKLRWPANEDDSNTWRKNWTDAFELRPREVITTSKELAVRLAALAKSIRQRANLILGIESEKGSLRKLHKAFQTALIHDLTEDDFADMYAQTIAYGLLAARVSRPAGIIADNLVDMIPTNPFLKDMLGTFLTVGGRKNKIDFDELGIQEVVDLLNRPDTHIEAVMRDFGKKTMQEDPVVHFYELFLKEYDKKKKVERGVFYTPQSVVSYIVRSVHELLKTEFGLEDGLASTVTWGEMVKRNAEIKIPEGVSPDEPFVLILDIATGTATFLVEVIEVIYTTMMEKWKKERHMAMEMPKLWNEYVPKHLLPRLYGFELMMAPYAIAHMKIGLKLAETGYRFGSNERAHIYLTNSLEPPSDIAEEIAANLFEALGHEAKAVNAVKRKKRFTVVVGNPPYSGISSNMSSWIAKQKIQDYKYVDGVHFNEKKHWLNDDYVQFIRLGEHYIEKTGEGILAYITNHGYLDNPTFRGMRWHLMTTFDDIYLFDLHGNANKREVAPDGEPDKNIFDIQQGVAIFVAVKTKQKDKNEPQTKVYHTELWGTREHKYETLGSCIVKTMPHKTTTPLRPFFFFIPQKLGQEVEYSDWFGASEMFTVNSTGVQTGDENILTDFSKGALIKKIEEHTSKKIADEFLRPYVQKPFDIRWMVFLETPKNNPIKSLKIPASYRSRYSIARHMHSDNVALLVGRSNKSGRIDHFFVSRYFSEVKCAERTTGSIFCPLYRYDMIFGNTDTKVPNLDPKIYGNIQKIVQKVTPESLFNYIYTVLHSPTYRRHYAELLKSDFPRIPYPKDSQTFNALAKIGDELVALHLMESLKMDKHITRFVGKGTPEVEKVTFSDETVWIDKAKSQGFQGVPENVWNFHIGGYQVCEKWLKDRKGRTLSADDINHYHRIVVALNETIRIMAEIDKVIEAHGGWPGAFQDKKADAEYTFQSEPLLKAAEETAAYSPHGKVEVYSKSTPSLKGDWQTWLALSQWVKETMSINIFWGDFALEISNSLKAGKKLTDKQKEEMKKCWKQAVKKGFRP